MLRLLTALMLLLVSVPASAETCTPQPLIFVYWGTYGVNLIPEQSSSANWVPATEVWQVLHVSGSIDTPSQLPTADYMLQDDTRQANGAFWYHTAIVKALNTNTTPAVIYPGATWLLPNHRFSMRTSITLPGDVRMGMHMTGLKYDVACLPQLLGAQASSGGGPGPDFTAFIAALGQAAQALQAVQESVP